MVTAATLRRLVDGKGPERFQSLPAAAEGEISLSPRELEICVLIAKGYPNKTIAGILDIRPCTVATYLRRIYAKLGVRCRAAMVAELYSRQLLDHIEDAGRAAIRA